MTGPEHYRAAEQLIEIAKNSQDAPIATAQLLAEAQIHATLALAAATADTAPGYFAAGWVEVGAIR